MRVIAGKFRGLRLKAPPGSQTRPMTDQVKETLFNVLGARLATPGALPETEILDLFAGSGALGIEALSRGARRCTFVERDRRSLNVLHDNLRSLRVRDTYSVLTDNAWTIRLPRARQGGYGLVFLDPPFQDVSETYRVADLIERIAARLLPDGLIVFRSDRKTDFPLNALRAVQVLDERHWGRNRVLLLALDDERGPAAEEQREEEDRAEQIGDNADRELAGPEKEAPEAVTDRQECPPRKH
jgi:16S rRNA (guanine966-N2)-methyltransferase